MAAIATEGLSKSYGSVQSLIDCTFQVPEGSVYGLLGPNGAGKTTLIRTLLGFLRPTHGSATVCDFDIVRQSRQAREQVSYLPGDARLYRGMRGRQVLELFGGLHRFGDRAHSLYVADTLDLDLSQRVMFMSTGMRQKLALSVVLGCRAPLLILDEPTANLDPNVRGQVIDLIRQARGDGRSVLLSSHIFSDIDDACDYVAIMRRGRLIHTQSTKSLQQLHIVRLGIEAPCPMPPWLSDHSQIPESLHFARLIPCGSDSPRTDEATISVKAIVCQLPNGKAMPAGFRLTPQHELELHLGGAPDRWLPWLSQLQFEVRSIEQAGVKAVYSRFHDPTRQTEGGSIPSAPADIMQEQTPGSSGDALERGASA